MIKEFTPTWLYIKQHNKTGLKYFGKTTRDPNKYVGSGKYWKDHLKTHGKDITHVWCELFTDKTQIMEFASLFSELNDIVNATDNKGKKIWGNVIPENGIDGGGNAGLPSPLRGIPQPHVTKALKGKKRPDHSKAMKGRKQTETHSANIAKALTGKIRSEEHSNNISKAKKGKKNPKVSKALKGCIGNNKGKILKVYPCKHCGVSTTGGNLVRWHNDNCKFKKEEANG